MGEGQGGGVALALGLTVAATVTVVVLLVLYVVAISAGATAYHLCLAALLWRLMGSPPGDLAAAGVVFAATARVADTSFVLRERDPS